MPATRRRQVPRVRTLLAQSDGLRRGWRSLRLRILEAEALDALGDRTGALRALLDALKRGVGDGYLRSFADEGTVLVPLLRTFVERSSADAEVLAPEVPRAYVARILEAAGAPVEGLELGDAEPGEPLEPLSEREREILRLVSVGLSNRALARRLFISEHTVKWHLLKVFQKLRVHDRSRAVARHHHLIQPESLTTSRE